MIQQNSVSSVPLFTEETTPFLVGPDELTLPQTENQVVLQVHGVPVLVNPESMIMQDPLGKNSLDESMVVGSDELSIAQKPDDSVVLQVHGKAVHVNTELLQLSNPVVNPPFNNWSIYQPSVPHDKGDEGKQDLGLRNIIIDGVNGYDFTQLDAQNPIVNPPFNNWSIYQPSVPHDTGDLGKQDLGLRDIIIDGVNGYDF